MTNLVVNLDTLYNLQDVSAVPFSNNLKLFELLKNNYVYASDVIIPDPQTYKQIWW